jgi:ubiquinone/menaquinone biosynthesis C-methylase UbiE
MSSENLPLTCAPKPMGWWERVVVPRLIGTCCAQPQIMKARSRIVPQAQGDVLELGCGGGINLSFYDMSRVKSLTGLDPSPGLLAQTRDQVATTGRNIEIHAGVGEHMPFKNAQFDTILVTFTLCSVDDPAQVMAEMKRVLRPDGRVLFLEHGAAPTPSVARWQRWIEPLWKRIGGNCHLTRPITAAYQAAGFKIVQATKAYMPKTPKPFGWIEWGEARL